MAGRGTGIALFALAALGLAMAKKRKAVAGDTIPDEDVPGTELPGDEQPETGMPPAWHPDTEPHGATPIEDWGEPEKAVLITQDTYRGAEHAALFRIYQGPQGGYWYAWKSETFSQEIFTGGPFATRDEVDANVRQSLMSVLGVPGAPGGMKG
jgi:hypothetical protein